MNTYAGLRGNALTASTAAVAVGTPSMTRQINYVAAGPQIVVTIEEIIKADPDIIIIGGTQAQKGIDQMMNDLQWASLKAVRNHRVYRNPVGTFNWDRYSAEAALQILWAGQIIQPQLFADINLVKETQKFYNDFLHFDLSGDDAERIIHGESPAN